MTAEDPRTDETVAEVATWERLEPKRILLELSQVAILGDWSEDAKARFRQEEDEARASERLPDQDYPEGSFRIRECV